MTTPMTPQTYNGPLPLKYKIAGIIGLITALLALRLPFWAWVGLAKLSRRLCPKPASLEHSRMLLEGTRWAGKFWPGQCTCIESALGALFAGVFFRSAPTWCNGYKFRPNKGHVWLESGGLPIGQAVDPAKEWPYQALIRI
jgi:Transglutaminase-like superfamily